MRKTKIAMMLLIVLLIVAGCTFETVKSEEQGTNEQTTMAKTTTEQMTTAETTQSAMTQAPMTEVSVMETSQTMAAITETSTVAVTQAPVTTQVEITKDVMPQTNAEGFLEMTIEQLMMYNGENDMPAYVVVEDVVYDVTDHSVWTTGSHGGNLAGTDITEMLKYNAPHGDSKLSEIVKVGIIIK